jgi:hypothetical protein
MFLKTPNRCIEKEAKDQKDVPQKATQLVRSEGFQPIAVEASIV